MNGIFPVLGAATAISDFMIQLETLLGASLGTGLSEVHELLLYMVFFIGVAAIIFEINRSPLEGSSLVRPVVRITIALALIVSLEQWFPIVEESFLVPTSYLNPTFLENPNRASNVIRDTLVSDSEVLKDLYDLSSDSYYSVSHGIARFFIWIATLIYTPMLLLQYILRWLLYLFMPLALGMFMMSITQGIAIRYFQQTLAILAWPVGFAVADAAAFNMHQDFIVEVAAGGTGSLVAIEVLMAGLLGSIMLLLGAFGTPIIMQMIFASNGLLGTFTGDNTAKALSPTIISSTMHANAASSGGSVVQNRSGAVGTGAIPPAFTANTAPFYSGGFKAPMPNVNSRVDPGGWGAAQTLIQRSTIKEPIVHI